MDFDRNTMAQRAKSLIKETKPSPALAGLILVVLMIALLTVAAYTPTPTMTAIVAAVLCVMIFFVSTGLDWYCLAVTREEKPVFSRMFDAFTHQQLTVFLVGVFRLVIISVLSVLFIAPGIIAFYSLRLSNHIIKDHPEYSAFRVLKESVSLMKGHKLELFKLDISFVVWYVLMLCSAFLVGIYAMPYIGVVYAEYYDYIKGQKEMFAD